MSGQLVNTIGHPGGYSDGDPTVAVNKFAWRRLNGNGSRTSVAADQFGGVWVQDERNRRILRFNYSSSEPIGTPMAFAPASYRAASLNASRVFSNYLEYSVNLTRLQWSPGPKASQDPAAAYPLAESWTLVRNWGAHILDLAVNPNPHGSGFVSVAQVAGRTFGLIEQANPPPGSGLPSTSAIVELDGTRGLQLRLVMNRSEPHRPPGYDFVTLQPDASIIYMVDDRGGNATTRWENVTQRFYRVLFDPTKVPHWLFPGERIATLHGRTDQLLSQTIMGMPRFPLTSDGSLIIFDSSTGKNKTSPGHHDPPNQGFHLGALRTSMSTPASAGAAAAAAASSAVGGNISAGSDTDGAWKWQASPWGKWGLIPGPPMQLGTEVVPDEGPNGLKLCEGYNISEMIVDPDTADGRYGGNDTAVTYAGNIPMAVGPDVVYGYHGEFWQASEANQFVHFRNGQFVGQFGLPNHAPLVYCGARKGTYRYQWALPGHAGNSFSPTLVNGRDDDELFMDHNDESGHGGLHRWRITGLSTITQHVVPLG